MYTRKGVCVLRSKRRDKRRLPSIGVSGSPPHAASDSDKAMGWEACNMGR